jgi:predicted phosphodiesterase
MILFCGDPHGRFDHILEAVRTHRPAAIVLLGDLQAPQPLEQVLAPILDKTDVWFIHGNHDTNSDADYDNLFGSALASRNLHGRIAEIDGRRVAGLGGVFRGQVWAPPAAWKAETPADYLAHCGEGNWWRDGLPRRHRSSIFPADYFAFAGQRADILVTHEAPSVHRHGFEAIDELARSLGVAKTFHGHHHDRLDYRRAWKRMGFEAWGVGHCGITDLNGTMLREGTFDVERSRRPTW